MEEQGAQEGEKYGGRDASGRGRHTSREGSQKAVLLDGRLDTFGHGVAEAEEGRRGAAAAPVDYGLIDPDSRQKDAEDHIGGQYSGGGQLCAVNKHL